MRQNNVHTETCHKSDDTLWNGEWFTIGRRVSPCHSKLFAFQILDTAEFVDDVKHICHTLSRMINVTLKVYKSRSLLKNAIFVSFCYSIHKIFLISMSLTDVHIITDTDYISHERYHVGCLTNGLTVCNLGFLLVQILYFKSKKVAGRSEGETGTCGVVTENGDSQTTLEYLRGNIVLSHEAEGVSNCENSLQLLVCFIPCPEEVVVVHFFEVKAVKLVDIIL